MFKCNILIFKFCTLLTKSTNQPAHEPTSTTNQPARHEPTAKQTQQGTKSSQQGICIGK